MSCRARCLSCVSSLNMHLCLSFLSVSRQVGTAKLKPDEALWVTTWRALAPKPQPQTPTPQGTFPNLEWWAVPAFEKGKHLPLLSSVTLPRPIHKGQSTAKERPQGSSYKDTSFFSKYSEIVWRSAFGHRKLLKVAQWSGSSNDALFLFLPAAFPAPWTRLSHTVGNWRGVSYPCGPVSESQIKVLQDFHGKP